MTFLRRLALGTFVLLGMGLAFFLWLNSPPPHPSPGLIEIPPGASARRVAWDLKTHGRVRSAHWFQFLARLQGADQRIKAGLYQSAPPRRATDLLRDLVAGRGETLRVTIPEGWATWQMADRVSALGLCSREDFLRAAEGLEGFLFPDTYYFEPHAPAPLVVQTLRARFDAEWDRLAASSSTAPGDTFLQLINGRRWNSHDLVTLASLIEREARRSDERARISAVYHNRLKIRMRLECDPTVQYALGHWKNPLLKKDLFIPHPYNTYRHFGLPPGPICSPGRDSLIAALHPAITNELYFVADETGGHRFSVTYEDHLRAVRSRRRLMKQIKKS